MQNLSVFKSEVINNKENSIMRHCFAGVVMIAEIILGLIVAICAGTAESKCYICGPAGYLLRVAIAAMICGIILFIIFAFSLTEKIWFIHWPATDFLNSIIFFFTYFIGSCWLAANITHGDADVAAVIFGFITAVAYGFSTWLTFLILREWYYGWQARRNQPRHVTATTTTTTTVVHMQ